MPETNLSNTVGEVVQYNVENHKLYDVTNLSDNTESTELLSQVTTCSESKAVTEEEKYKAIQVRNKDIGLQLKLQSKKRKAAQEKKRRAQQIKINAETEKYISLQKKLKSEKDKLAEYRKIQKTSMLNIKQEVRQEKVLLNYIEQQAEIAAAKARVMKKKKEKVLLNYIEQQAEIAAAKARIMKKKKK